MDVALPLFPALLFSNARRACACRRATSCGVGVGGGASGSAVVSALPFALFPRFLFFFEGGSCEVVDDEGVGDEM